MVYGTSIIEKNEDQINLKLNNSNKINLLKF